MKTKRIGSILSCALFTMVISISTVTYKVSAAGTQNNYNRIYGQDRYQTAVKASQAGWSDGANYAVIVSGEEYTDSFCAVPLAKANNAPILLTRRNSIDLETLNEIKRLKVKYIYLIGGESYISKNVEEQLKLQGISKVERLSGSDRYETSVKIAEKLGPSSKVILVSDKGYADALSAATVAAIEGIPILVTCTNIVPNSISKYITSNEIKNTYVIGGTASISNSVAFSMPGLQRIEGENRYETNIKVMKNFSKDFDFSNVYTVSASAALINAFADSLGGAALAAKTNSPIVLVGNELENSTREFIKSNIFPNSKITVLAGESAIPNSAIGEVQIDAKSLNISNETYEDSIQGNADIAADNISFKGNVSGNLYIEGNNASVNNSVVSNTVFIDPGKDGITKLDSVTAKNIVILSGTKDGIHLKNVKADTLIIRSKNKTKVILEDKTTIKSTIAASESILDNVVGNFGNVTITGNSIDKPVEFSGAFYKPIIVESSAMVQTSKNTIIPELDIVPTGAGKRVILDGAYNDIEVNGEADVLMTADTVVKGSMNVNSPATIHGNESESINRIDISPSNSETINLTGNFGTTYIYVNNNSKINVKSGAVINLIKVDKEAALVVYINIAKGAEVYQVKGDAILTGDGSENTVQTPYTD